MNIIFLTNICIEFSLYLACYTHIVTFSTDHKCLKEFVNASLK